MKKRLHLLLFLSPIFLSAYSQEDDFSSSFLEDIESFQEEDGEQFDVENLLDLLNELKEQKIDLNSADEEDWEQLPFLTPNDAHNLVLHRKLYGDYQTLYELKNIPDFGEDKIHQILPFVTINKKERKESMAEMIRRGESQIHIACDRYLQHKKGYEPDSNGVSKYAGSPHHYYAKHLFTSERFKAALVGEKDAGEAEWSENGHGFDFVSFSAEAINFKRMKQICLGDFKANFGQGLVIGTGSILGKNASVSTAYKSTQGLKRYASTGETDFFRGAGATLLLGKTSLSLFGSFKNGDATLKGEDISSFKTDGLHRTSSEIEKKGNHTQYALGANLRYQHKKFTIGQTFLLYGFSRVLQPAEKTYNHFKLSQTKRHWNTGTDYKFRLRHASFYGEFAFDANRHFATMNGISLFPLSRMEITIAQRYYAYGYQSYYGKGFAENSEIGNEQGIYLRTRFSPIKRLTFAFYADCFKFPWALYSVDVSSSGQEFCVQTECKATQASLFTIKYKYKEKTEAHNAKQNLRATINTRIGTLRIQTIAEGNRSDAAENAPTYGWILSQMISGNVKPLHLSTALRYAYFHAKDYNNRIYIYEKDLPYTLSFPMHYGEGHRIALCMTWKRSDMVQINAKAGWFIYTDGRDHIGTGTETMEGNVSTQVKIMIKLKI